MDNLLAAIALCARCAGRALRGAAACVGGAPHAEGSADLWIVCAQEMVERILELTEDDPRA